MFWIGLAIAFCGAMAYDRAGSWLKLWAQIEAEKIRHELAKR